MSDYPLKSTGETYLRMQIARFKSFKTKMKKATKNSRETNNEEKMIIKQRYHSLKRDPK